LLIKRGFTLLELLISITILAVISIIGYQTLSGMINSQQSLKLRDRKLNQLQTAYVQWQADCINIEKEPIKNIANNLQVTMNQGKINSIFMIRRNIIDLNSSWQLIIYTKKQQDWIRTAFLPTANNQQLLKNLALISRINFDNLDSLEITNNVYNSVSLLSIKEFNLKVWQDKLWQDYLLVNPQAEVRGLKLELNLTDDWENIGQKQQFNCFVNL